MLRLLLPGSDNQSHLIFCCHTTLKKRSFLVSMAVEIMKEDSPYWTWGLGFKINFPVCKTENKIKFKHWKLNPTITLQVQCHRESLKQNKIILSIPHSSFTDTQNLLRYINIQVQLRKTNYVSFWIIPFFFFFKQTKFRQWSTNTYIITGHIIFCQNSSTSGCYTVWMVSRKAANTCTHSKQKLKKQY